MDEKRKNNLLLRSKMIQAIRRYFAEQGFVEIETPCLVSSPGMEPHLLALEVDCTNPDGKRIKRYLHTSPEYAMKKLLGEGWDRIFQICRVFRDGEIGSTHQIEFTMLEWYRIEVDYRKIMEDCEGLIRYLAHRVLGSDELIYGQKRVNLSPPFERLSVARAMELYGGITLQGPEPTSLLAQARAKGYQFSGDDTYGDEDIFFKVFLEAVEPRLGSPRPTLLFDYPASMAALARLNPENPLWAERFELYIAGLELANAFSELNDPEEQRRRFEGEQRLRAKLARPVYPIDEDLLRALSGMPPAAGIALGVDRLAMLFCDAPAIQEVLAFPLY